VLSAHCEQVLEAEGIGEAHRIVGSEAGLSLVLCEASLGDGDAGDLLVDVATRAGDRPPVIVIAARGSEDESKRMLDLGAAAYLTKPISFLDVSRAVKRGRQKLPQVARRIHRRPLGTALVLDEATGDDRRREIVSHVLWDIHDISTSGAFLETRGPVSPGQELSLGLVLDGQMLRVHARIMRQQEPCWEHAAGIGVAFLAFEDGARQQLEAFVERHAAD
jgi:CheY-like chemotaxis protein